MRRRVVMSRVKNAFKIKDAAESAASFILIWKGLHLPAVYLPVENSCQRDRDNLCDGNCPPYGRQAEKPGQYICGRKQHEHLARQ